MNNIILYFAVKYSGDFDKIFQAIMKKEKCDYNEVERIKNSINCKFTTIISSDYPLKLKNLNKPPFIIFYEGDLSLLERKSVAIIGSRNNSEYGEEITQKIVKKLVEKEYVIISGLAKGIDSLSHLEALKNNGSTIGVLGNGINYYYPRNNKDVQDNIREKGLLISEYPPFEKPNKEYFPKRNRIIAALCDGLIVIESKRRSGTMITVNEALNLGKDIMCVPSRANEDSGCNYLIKNGAYLIEDGNDVLDILNDK